MINVHMFAIYYNNCKINIAILDTFVVNKLVSVSC